MSPSQRSKLFPEGVRVLLVEFTSRRTHAAAASPDRAGLAPGPSRRGRRVPAEPKHRDRVEGQSSIERRQGCDGPEWRLGPNGGGIACHGAGHGVSGVSEEHEAGVAQLLFNSQAFRRGSPVDDTNDGGRSPEGELAVLGNPGSATRGLVNRIGAEGGSGVPELLAAGGPWPGPSVPRSPHTPCCPGRRRQSG